MVLHSASGNQDVQNFSRLGFLRRGIVVHVQSAGVAVAPQFPYVNVRAPAMPEAVTA